MTGIERSAAIVGMAIVSFGIGAAIPTLGTSIAPGATVAPVAPVAPAATTAMAPAKVQLLPAITSQDSGPVLTHRHTVLV